MRHLAGKRDAAIGTGCLMAALGAGLVHIGLGLLVAGLSVAGYAAWQWRGGERRFGDLLLADTAERAVRRESAGVARAAARGDAAVREFYNEHAEWLSMALHLPLPQARDYCARHCRDAQKGAPALERDAVADLVWLVQQQHGE